MSNDFRRPDRHANIVKLLREFFAEERELENDEALQEMARKAKAIPRWLVRFPARHAP